MKAATIVMLISGIDCLQFFEMFSFLLFYRDCVVKKRYFTMRFIYSDKKISSLKQEFSKQTIKKIFFSIQNLFSHLFDISFVFV